MIKSSAPDYADTQLFSYTLTKRKVSSLVPSYLCMYICVRLTKINMACALAIFCTCSSLESEQRKNKKAFKNAGIM